jgi:hypothetical protein
MKNGVVNWFVLVIVKVKALIVMCEEAACGRGRTISRMLKDCAAKVYTTFLMQPKIWNYILENEQAKFTSLSINTYIQIRLTYCFLIFI